MLRRFTGLFKDIDWPGIVAFAVVAQLLIFAQPARAHTDEAAATPTGSGYVQQRAGYCQSWARFAGRVHAARLNGTLDISESQFFAALKVAGDPEEDALPIIKQVLAESYNWPTADDRLEGWIFTRCMKGWANEEPEAAPADPESQSRAPVTFGFVAVKGQPMSCTNSVARAFDMVHGITGFLHSDFRPENYNNEADRQVAERAWLCKNVAEEKFRECFVARCMEQQT